MHRAWLIQDIWEHIVPHISKADLCRLARTCRHLQALSEAALWHELDTPDAFCRHLPTDFKHVSLQDIAKLDKYWSIIRTVKFVKIGDESAMPQAFPGSRTVDWTAMCYRIARLRPPNTAFSSLRTVHLESSRLHFLLPLMGIRAPQSLTFKDNWEVKMKYVLAHRFLRTLDTPERLQCLDIHEDYIPEVRYLPGLRSLRLVYYSERFLRPHGCPWTPGLQERFVSQLPANILLLDDDSILGTLNSVLEAILHVDKRRSQLGPREDRNTLQVLTAGRSSLLAQNLARILAVNGCTMSTEASHASFVYSIMLSTGMPQLTRLQLCSPPHFLFDYAPEKYAVFAANVPSLTHLTTGTERHYSTYGNFHYSDSPPLHHLALFASMLPKLFSLANLDWWEPPDIVKGTISCDVKALDLRILRPDGWGRRSIRTLLQRHLKVLFPLSDMLRAVQPNVSSTRPVTIVSLAYGPNQHPQRVVFS